MYDKVLFKFKWWRNHSLRDQVLNIRRLLDVMPAEENEALAKLCSLLESTRGDTSAFVLAYTFGPSILRSGRKAADLLATADQGNLKNLKTELVVNPRLVNSFLTMLIKYNAAIFSNDMRIVDREEIDAGIAAAAGAGGGTADASSAPVISLQDRITAVTRARLIKVYTEKQPSRLPNVDQLCFKYRGKEREMLQVGGCVGGWVRHNAARPSTSCWVGSALACIACVRVAMFIPNPPNPCACARWRPSRRVC